jgi:hypothetical protein
MRRAAFRLLAFLVALLVALPSLASTGTHYFCRVMDRVLPECCCAHEDSRDKPSEGTEIRATDCCERMSAAARTGSASLSDVPRHVAPLALVATLPLFTAAALPTSEALAPIPNAQAPPGLGPPLFLKNCSLLT